MKRQILAVPGFPVDDGVAFLCGCCGLSQWMAVEGGAPEAGEQVDVSCDRCSCVNRVTVRLSRFGPASGPDGETGWQEVRAELVPCASGKEPA